MTAYHDISLSLIKVSGDDAGNFLQGQLTCNINELTDRKASIAAFCNAKGRVISTLLVIKTDQGYLLILPQSLQQIVLKKLQIYVLRSKVELSAADDLAVAGLVPAKVTQGDALPELTFHYTKREGMLYLRLPSANPRYLCLAANLAMSSFNSHDAISAPDGEWRYLDISSGLPWFDADKSEHYTPQMLNLDQLGGISFNKGCYTGQEIIARTHYLGQAKRQMYLGECLTQLAVDQNTPILVGQSKEKFGDILISQTLGQSTRMLIVAQTVDDTPKTLILDDANHTPVSLLPFE
jgi:folate-binding protein YgfZ